MLKLYHNCRLPTFSLTHPIYYVVRRWTRCRTWRTLTAWSTATWSRATSCWTSAGTSSCATSASADGSSTPRRRHAVQAARLIWRSVVLILAVVRGPVTKRKLLREYKIGIRTTLCVNLGDKLSVYQVEKGQISEHIQTFPFIILVELNLFTLIVFPALCSRF